MAYFERLPYVKRGGNVGGLDPEPRVAEWITHSLQPVLDHENTFFELTELTLEGNLEHSELDDMIPPVPHDTMYANTRRQIGYEHQNDMHNSARAYKGAALSGTPNRFISREQHRRLARKPVSAIPLSMGYREALSDVSSRSRGHIGHMGARHYPIANSRGHHHSHKHIMR